MQQQTRLARFRKFGLLGLAGAALVALGFWAAGNSAHAGCAKRDGRGVMHPAHWEHFAHARAGDAMRHMGMGAMGKHGKKKGRLGIRLQPMTEDLRAFFKAPKDQGVLVASVRDDSPAGKAGLRAGDVILDIAGEEAEKLRDIMKVARKADAGDKLALTVLRDGSKKKLTVTAPARPEGRDGGKRSMRRGGGKKMKALEARLRAIEEKLGLPAPAGGDDSKE